MTLEEIKKEIASIKHVRMQGCLNSDYRTGYVCALSAVERMLADLDAVPVTYCRDCLHWKHHVYKSKPYGYDYHSCDVFDWKSDADDYCSFAERKDDAEVVMQEPERKHGRWLDGGIRPHCSACGFYGSIIDQPVSPFKYCPNCGAIMDEEE